MIAFLAVSAILNIAIGYVLAMYLGGYGRHAEPMPAQRHQVAAAPAPAQPVQMPLAAKVEPAIAVAAPPQPAEQKPLHEALQTKEATPVLAAVDSAKAATTAPAEIRPGDVSDLHAHPDETLAGETEKPAEADANSPQVENELLAGIEEFRNQLAQMKGQGPPAPAVRPESVTA